MENIPNEILEKIIGYLDKKAVLSVRLLNSTWQDYAEDYLRKMSYFSLKFDQDVSDLIRITSWRNENTIPIPFVRFSITEELSKESIEKLSQKYGNVIQSLRLRNFSSMELLMNTPNINEIYVNNWNPIDMKTFQTLNLPKLRIFELENMDTDFAKLILSSSPNIQQVKFGYRIGGITEDNWIDHITIFQSIATRGIELKLEICIDSDQVNLQRMNEMTKISFKVTELGLVFKTYGFAAEELSLVRELMENFIHKHSATLKFLEIYNDGDGLDDYTEEEDKNHLKFNLKNLDNLEVLKLVDLQANLGPTPMLKKIILECYAQLNVQSTPLLKHLRIETKKILPQFLDGSFRLEDLSLHFTGYTLTTTETDERVQQLNNFLLSNAKNLKVLKIETYDSTGMNKLKLPEMENLQKLILPLWNGGNAEFLKLQKSNLPHLKFLKLLRVPLYANPTLNESFESVRTLKIFPESLIDFKNTVLQFPMLKKLHIGRIHAGVLRFVFKNLAHLEELKIQSDSGVTWDELTGNSKVVDFLGEPSAGNLNTSNPNLGDLIDLKRLRLKITTTRACMNEVTAISYLVSCGKLKYLKYFEVKLISGEGGVSVGLPDLELQELMLIPFVKIIESNNIRIKISYEK